MRLSSVVLLFAMLFAAATAVAENPSKVTDAELAAITARGVMLAGFDTAAWYATDAVLATHPTDGPVQCYVARKADVGWIVAFGRLNESRDKFLNAFDAIQNDTPDHFTVVIHETPKEETGFNLMAARAIETARNDFRGENRPYNVAVIPETEGRLFVYLYPAQVKAGVYPLGGDVRYLISPDGLTIIEKRQLHKTIIERTAKDIPAGAKEAAGYHTHVLSDLPEDTDVLFVLTRKPNMPEFVGAGKHVFKIDISGKISIVK
jgi:hypothetical protein